MANVLRAEKQAMAVAALAEGQSIRAIERMTGIHRDTIMRLGARVGLGCDQMMRETMRDLPCQRVLLPCASATSMGEQRMAKIDGISGQFGTILIDPPWRFMNRTGKVAPEHKRLSRYRTMSFEEIAALPVGNLALPKSHLYLWCPNALLPEAFPIMKAWGFTYKANIVWYKIRKDGGPDGRGVGFYFRNVTEVLLFGIKGKLRTLQPGRSQVNIVATRKQEHSRKPDEMYDVIQRCSSGPFLEMFARQRVKGWSQWGDEVDSYEERRPVYKGYSGRTTVAACSSSTLDRSLSSRTEPPTTISWRARHRPTRD